MTHLSFVLVWLLSLHAVGVAQGQTNAATQANPSAGGAVNGSVTSTSRETNVTAPATLGWNYGHPIVCEPVDDGTTNWLFVYMKEGGYIWTNFKPFMDALMPACQSGNWVGFYVVNTSGSWSHVLVYSYK
jgi:hypothetical protein